MQTIHTNLHEPTQLCHTTLTFRTRYKGKAFQHTKRKEPVPQNENGSMHGGILTLINAKCDKIPSKTQSTKSHTYFNHTLFQDLFYLPVDSPDGHKYVSVIVDAHTR
eukprot:GHVR01110330.1.p1 GENE.GHVR01110330.1~~GHVR01110330.1.p1  ORF type:complete len:107 (-),score=9.30 GHVR01110330.1:325-645(-)